MMSVFRNNKGLTLVEVLISLVITLVVFLGLMQTAMLTMDVNVNNLFREEAVSIGENRMRELREMSAASLQAVVWADTHEFRRFRNIVAPIDYTVTVSVTNIGAGTDARQLEIVIAWTTPKGDALTHTITTIKRL